MAADGTNPFADIPVTRKPAATATAGGGNPFADIPVGPKAAADPFADIPMAATAEKPAPEPVARPRIATPAPPDKSWIDEVLQNPVTQTLLDNFVTRGAAQAGTAMAEGANELLDRAVLAPAQYALRKLGVDNDVSDTFRAKAQNPLAGQMRQLDAPEDAPAWVKYAQMGTRLPFELAGALALGGETKGAEAASRIPEVAQSLRAMLEKGVKSPAMRVASTVGAEQSGSQAAEMGAAGHPVSDAQLGQMFLANTAGNLLPVGQSLPYLARPFIGAASGVGGQFLSNLASGHEGTLEEYAQAAALSGLLGAATPGERASGAPSRKVVAPEAKAVEATEAALLKANFTPEQIADFKRSVEQKQAEQAQPAPEAPQRPPEPEAAQPTPEPVAESAQTQVKPENAPTPTADRAQAMERARGAEAVAQERADMGLTLDVERAQQARQEGVKTAEADALQHGASGESPLPEAQPAPAAPVDPAIEQRYFDDLDKEIGWDQEGGKIIRAGNDGSAGNADDPLGIGPEPGRSDGAVTGRTSWLGMPRVDGEGESSFWRNRPPNARLTPDRARAALAKARAGEPLKPIEQRFVDYAKRQAHDYAQEHADEAARQQAIRHDMDAEAIARQRQAWQDENIGVHPGDEGEALTLQQWVERAHNAGVDVNDAIWAAHATPDPREKAQRFAQLIAEKKHGAEQTAGTGDHRVGVREGGAGRTLPDPETGGGIEASEGTGGGGLFPEPTGAERIRAAAEAKDAERNGLNRPSQPFTNTDLGATPHGEAPEQATLEPPARSARNEPPQTASGVPEGLPAEQTDATRNLARKLNRWRASMGAGKSVRFREIPRHVLPDALGRALAAFERFSGTRVHVVRNLTPDADRFNGVSFRDGHLYIDDTTQNPVTTTAAHEFTHQLRKDHPDLYNALEAEVRRQGRIPEWQRKLDGMARGEKVNEGVAAEELTANAVGDALSDPEFLRRMAERNPSAFREMAQRFIEFINKFLGKARDLGSNQYLTDVAAFRDRLADVLDEFAGREKPVREPLPHSDEIDPAFQRVFHGGPRRGINNDVTPYYSRRVGDGDHGPVFEADNYHEAVDTLLRAKAGEVKSALFHPSIGHADLIYGKQGSPAKDYADGYGLAKIIAKHPEVDVKSLENELLAAREPRYHGNVAEFDTPRYTMAFKRDWRGQKKTWLLTAFDPKEESATGSTRIGAAAARDEARSNPVADKTSLPQTDTPTFRRWFGESKAVDAEGRPLTLYHGTGEGFHTFDNGRLGANTGHMTSPLGHFLTEDRRAAKAYADKASGYVEPDARVIDAHLSMQNPKEMTAAEFQAIDSFDQARALRAKLEHEGYDGIHIPEYRQWVAFDPAQIKSSSENVGTFDAGNPDIRFSRREGEEPAAPEHDVTMGRGFSGPAVDAPDVPARVPARQRTADMFDKPFPINEGRADKARFYLQDKFIDLQRIQEGIESTTRQVLDDAANVKQSAELFTSRTAAQIEDVRANVERPIVNLIHNSGLDVDAVGDWLTARHAVERNARIREIRPDMDSGSGMSDADAKATLARYSGNEAMQRIGAIADWIVSKNRQMQVGAGLVSAEEALGWQQMYQHYVPLKGFENTPEGVRANFEGPGRGFDVRGKVKHAFGRKSRSANPLANLLADYERTIVRANKAEVGRALYKLAADHPNSALWEINKVPSVPRIDKQTGLVTYGPDPMYKFADNVINVKIDGEDHTITMHGEQGERFAKAFKNLSTEMQSSVIRGLSRVNRYLAAVNTSLNPEFMLSNFVRDVQTAFVNLSGTEAKAVRGKVIRDIPHAMKALRDVLRKGKADSEWGQYAKEFRSDGGMTMWLDAHYDVDKLTSSLARQVRNLKRGGLHPARVFSTIGKFIEDYNKIVENGVRLSTYVHARKLGLSRPKAAHLAKDLTVNFDRKGQLGPVINSLYLFFNASMQGSVRVLQALKHPAVRRIVYATIAASAGMSIANRAVGGKDEDGVSFYDKIPDYEKERNLILMLPPDLDLPDWMESEQGGGKYIKITLPYGYNVFKVVGDQIGDALAAGFGYKQHFQPVSGAVAVMNSVIGAFNPLGSSPFDVPAQTLAPSVADPAVQIWTNKTWYGAPMYPDKNPFANTPKPDTQLYWNSTSQAARKLASLLGKATGGDEIVPGAIDVSPITLDTLWDTITGGAGATALRASKVGTKLATGGDLEPREIPFVRKVLGAVESRRFDRQTYYDNLTRIGQAKQELEAATTPARRKEVVETWGPYLRSRGIERASERALRNLRAQQKRVEASSLSEKEKKARKEKIEAQMHTVRTRLNVAVENAREQAKAQP